MGSRLSGKIAEKYSPQKGLGFVKSDYSNLSNIASIDEIKKSLVPRNNNLKNFGYQPRYRPVKRGLESGRYVECHGGVGVFDVDALRRMRNSTKKNVETVEDEYNAYEARIKEIIDKINGLIKSKLKDTQYEEYFPETSRLLTVLVIEDYKEAFPGWTNDPMVSGSTEVNAGAFTPKELKEFIAMRFQDMVATIAYRAREDNGVESILISENGRFIRGVEEGIVNRIQISPFNSREFLHLLYLDLVSFLKDGGKINDGGVAGGWGELLLNDENNLIIKF